MKIWSPDLSATQIPPMCCRVYGEVCTGSPTVARLEYSGTDPEEARRKAEEAVKRPEVLAASVRTVDEGSEAEA